MSAASSAVGSTRAAVQTAYRRLLKAQRMAFDKDAFMQTNAKREIRKHFVTPMPPSSATLTPQQRLDEQLQRAQEAEEYLLQNVVQAKKGPSGRFVMEVQERHTVPDPAPPSN